MDKEALAVHSDMDPDKINTSSKGGFIVRNQSGFSTAYRLVDLVIITCIFYVCHLYLVSFIPDNSIVALLIFAVIFQLVAEAMDLYRSWRGYSTTEILKNTGYCWSITCILSLTAYFILGINTLNNAVLISWFVTSAGALLSWRFVMRKFLFKIRQSGMNTRQAIVIGATKTGYSLAHQIVDNEQLGINFQGMFDDRAEDRLPHKFKNQVLGGIEDAIEMARANKVDYIYIALPMSAENRIRDILEKCADTTANVYIIPNFFIYNLMNARWQSIGSVQALSVYDTPFQGASDLLKRAEDIVLSSIILLMLTLPMLCIAAAVKLTSPGPVIFKQNVMV